MLVVLDEQAEVAAFDHHSHVKRETHPTRADGADNSVVRTVHPIEQRQQRIRAPHRIHTAIVQQTTSEVAGKCMCQVIRRALRQIEARVGRSWPKYTLPRSTVSRHARTLASALAWVLLPRVSSCEPIVENGAQKRNHIIIDP